eukprot:2911801-Rhodomonas_salina.1
MGLTISVLTLACNLGQVRRVDDLRGAARRGPGGCPAGQGPRARHHFREPKALATTHRKPKPLASLLEPTFLYHEGGIV